MSEIRLASQLGVIRLLCFGIGLFALLNLIDGADFFHAAGYQLQRRDIPNPLCNTFAYVGVYALCLAGLSVGLLHHARWVRWPVYLLTAITVTTDVGFRQFNGYGFSYHEASLIWSEAEFIGDAIAVAFRGVVFPLLGSAVLLFAFERWGRPRVPSLRSWLWLLLPILAIPACRNMLESTYSKVYQFPLPYRVVMLTEHTYRHQLLFYGRRDAPYMEPSQTPMADHILLIIDESVTGSLLGINHASQDTTPYLDSVPERVFHYGIASSPSNLSSTSNIIIQSGLRPDQIPDRELRALKNPNLFSYMQKAGYKSFLIDSQIYSDKPTNLMTGFDLESLDGHLYVRVKNVSTPEYNMDMRAIDYIQEITSNNERSFTYLVKAGAHFPYDAKYPPDRDFFQPTLASGGTDNNLRKTLNSYQNALRWTVDEFLRAIIKRYEGSSTSLLVVYTSDHGQSLHEAVNDTGRARDGRPTRWPHGAPITPPAQQADVPLLVFATEPHTHKSLARLYRPELRDRVSGFEIFPSILQLAGYPMAAIRERYGPSIFDASVKRGPRKFVSGNLFGIGGGFYQSTLIHEATYMNAFDAVP